MHARVIKIWNSSVLIAMQRDEDIPFTYIPHVTAKVSICPEGLVHLYGEE